MIRIEKYDIKREIEDLIKKIAPVTPSAGLTFYDYIIEIYDVNNIVVRSASETITLSSLADLNNWIKNTRDKKIMIIAYKYVSDYIALTRNFYYFIGNYYEIDIMEQNTIVIVDGFVKYLYNWDPINRIVPDISNSIIIAQYVDLIDIEDAGIIDTLIANADEVDLYNTIINYIYINTDVISAVGITINTGYIRSLFRTMPFENVNVTGIATFVLGYTVRKIIYPNLVDEINVPNVSISKCYDIVVIEFSINNKGSNINPNVYYEKNADLCKVRIVNNSPDIVEYYIHLINHQSVG